MTKVEILTIFIYFLKYANSQGCTLPIGPNFGQDLIRVKFNEVDTQSTLDGNPQEYRGWLGISAPESTVTVTLSQKDAPAVPEELEPAEYFRIDYYTNEPRTGQTGFFIQLTKSVDRDGINPDLVDDLNSVEYQIACSEDSNPGFVTYYLVRVIFEDLNDNSPIFTQTLYSGTVNELTPIGTTIFQSLSYTDLDEGSFGRGDFAILPGDGTEFDGSTKFQIQTSATGEVSVKNVLDFEVLNEAQRPVYSLNVSVSDGGNPRRVSYSTLKLTITDGDDLPPEFVYESCIIDSGVCFNPLYITSITSGLTTGAISVFPVPAAPNNVATTIQARDQDTMNHTIQFSVLYTEPQGYENRFSVVTTGPFNNPAGTPSYKSPLYTAQISLVSPINRNDPVLLAAGGQLQVIIKAQEQELNKRFNRAILLVNVNPANSNNPQITGTLTPPFIGYIREDAAVGTLASSPDLSEPMRLIFSDADLTGGLTQDYDITVTPSTIFTVDANGFVRLVANALDYENLRSYTFDVTITERTPERRSGSTSVTINVLDVNDNTPRFLSNNGRYVESISEGIYTVGSPRFITSMSATDDDFSTASNQVRYAIESVEPLPFNKFAVSNTGAITLQGTVVEGERYVVTVRASDNGNPSLSNVGVLYLTITSAGNKGPQIREQNYAITVSEGILLNSIVFNLTATDPENGPITYRITGGNTNTDFAINNVGSISNIRLLDRETTSSYTLDLEVEDNTALTATTKLFITVTDVNDNSPRFVEPAYVRSVDEGVVNRLLATVTATDDDIGQNAVFTYSLLNDRQNLFRIDSTSGEFSVGNVALDYETQRIHYLTVAAIDAGPTPRTGTVSVTVNVLDINDNNPKFNPLNYEVSIPETPNVTPIVTVFARDMDATPNVVYKLVTSTDSNAFTINGNSGLISSKANVLDFENKQRYSFQVTTTDGEGKGELSGTASVIVNILDVNDGRPVLQLNTVDANLLETDPIGKLISTAIATDTDAGNNGRIVYSINNSQPPFGSNLFYINPTTGEIVVRDLLTTDPVRNTVYTLTIKASDQGTNPLSDTASLRINVRRNLPPVFNPNSFTLPAIDVTTPVKTPIGSISATDPDTIAPFNLVTHTLIGDGSAEEYFQIDNNGNVAVRRDLGLDSPLQYTLRVRATDGPGLSDEAVVTINVNRNINAPILNQQNYTETIIYTLAANDPILTIQASDSDRNAPHNTLTYTIIGDAIAQTYLQVASNGDVSLFRSVRDTPLTRLDAVVRVSDNGLPNSRTAARLAYVTIIIERNVNAPIFFGNFDLTIQETQTVNVPFLTVFANDSDARPEFRQISYELIGDSPATDYFRVSQNGDVSVTTELGTDDGREKYFLRIVAKDSQINPNSAMALVTITVIRNFVDPVWQANRYDNEIGETQPLSEVFRTVRATDSDSTAASNTVFYELVGDAKGLEYFQIGRESGGISVKRALWTDTDRPTTYYLQVRAFDGGNPSRSATPNVPVVVTVYRNNFAPVFQGSPFEPVINRGFIDGQEIEIVTALDNDPPTRYGKITWSITGPPDAQNLFNINADTGRITVRNAAILNTRTDLQFFIYVQAADDGTPAKSTTTVVRLSVVRNLEAPILKPENITKNVIIDEATDLGTVIETVYAKGEAIPRPTGVTFEIVGYSDAPEYFEIDANTGVITAKKDLRTDPLRQTSYELQVLASYEENNKNLTATINVMINVDRDDLPPEFVYESCIIDSGVCFNPLYRTYVTSRTSGPLTMYPIPTASGDATTIIQARNQNYGQNQSIQFSVVYTEPQGYENRFSVVTTGPFNNPAGTPSYKSPLYTAQISLIRTIDRNDPDLLAAGGQLQVIIKAEEQTSNKRSENAMLLVDMRPFEGEPVLDGNLSPPFTGYIMENSNIGSFVVDINLIKPMRLFITDVTGLAEKEDYDMSIGPYSGIFNIDNDGHIKLASNTIDSEIKKYHNFNVILKKKVDASTQDTVAVRIFILDVNDNSPIFNLHSKSILSKAIPAGDYTKPKFIADVSASDKDVSYSNNRITYQADSVPDSTNKFYVDKDGILYVQGFVSDGESYTIYVSASDNGTPPNRASIVISLQVTGVNGCSDLTITYKLFVVLVFLCLL